MYTTLRAIVWHEYWLFYPPIFLMPECITQSLIEKKKNNLKIPSFLPSVSPSIPPVNPFLLEATVTCLKLLLLFSYSLVSPSPNPGGPPKTAFYPPVLRLLFQRLKKAEHVSLADGNPDSCLIFPSTCLVTLGKFLPITNLTISSSVKWG